MMNSAYYGHDLQLFGVEEYRLTGGKGDGMRFLQVRNGLGLEFSVCADRCADIARLSFRGDNYGFFSNNGHVSSHYYDDVGDGWLKTFSAGFLTTCGLLAVGSPCVDGGEALGLHGAVSTIPAERISWEMDSESIRIKAVVNHSLVYGDKLILNRTITCSKVKNELTITDKIENIGHKVSPLMILYHFNIGYPLLSENAQLRIPAKRVLARNEHAAQSLDKWSEILPPTPGFEEQCYYHEFDGAPVDAAIFNPDISKGLRMRYDSAMLDCFNQWKHTGYKDYVMGLEPGNCYPDGRPEMRRQGRLKTLEPGEKTTYSVTLSMIENEAQWKQLQTL